MANHRSHHEGQGLKSVYLEFERKSKVKSIIYHEGHEDPEEKLKNLPRRAPRKHKDAFMGF
jgi:hypothetical protein